MTIFSLDVRRAHKGDCLLLHFGSANEPGLAIIDGGPGDTYRPHLRPRLQEIRKARRLSRADPLPVDLLMVSHVDDDHIHGLLELTKELRGASGAPFVRVLNFWHNSFDDLIGHTPDELTAAFTAQFGAASLAGGLPAGATVDADEEEEVIVDSLKVLASIEQGHRLRGDAEALGFPLNQEFDEQLILAGRKALEMADGLTFTVAGPMKPELLKLQKKHDEFLEAQQERTKKRTAAAALAAYVDRSVPNLSSIVVLAKSGTKRMLLTGDARGDKILKGLELAGALKREKTMHVDVMKVPHHGSNNNLDDDFFERVTADHYVFSGDGEHGNPERESFEMLVDARGTDPFELHLTYPLAEIDAARKAEWQKMQAREKARKAKGGKKQPRENWSAARHGLVSFFKAGRLGSGQRLRIVDAKKPHVIDLLDPLGY
jgi:hypothetical protein